MPGHSVKYVGVGEQLVDLGGCCGVEFTQDNQRVTERAELERAELERAGRWPR
ncbi:MAG TPA: hypothetical protein VN327_17035 [Pseudonocardiaceae bacterium]|nr:hypothetical protein [Pseudonocardiaceae bacterium]